MKLCGWCEKATATTRYTAPELAGMYVSVCVPCLNAEREARKARIAQERAEYEARRAALSPAPTRLDERD